MASSKPIATPAIPVSDAIFTCAARITIDAPADKVYHTLLRFPEYEKWNAYFPFAEPSSNLFGVGSKLTLYYRHDDKKAAVNKVEVDITEVDSPDSRLRYTYGSSLGMPRWLYRFEKVHWVTPLNSGVSEIEIWETFAGYLAYLIRPMMAETITQCTQGLLEGLKAWIEQGEEVSAAKVAKP